jgi:hypothetical protein
MKPLIWEHGDCGNRYIMDYNWRPMEERVSGVVFMQGKHLPCPDVGRIKCSLDPKEYDLIFASESPPEEFKKFDCLSNNSTALLVNQKILDIFKGLCLNDIQEFPTTIIPAAGSSYKFENHDYWLINITKLVDAIDLKKSLVSFYEEAPDTVSSIKKLVFLDKEEFEKPFIARIDHEYGLKIVSPSLVKAFKEANVMGVQFTEDKDYF